ncbi:hypothetical protein G7Y89_g15260 [Cudoniella acicularis]|uniref:Uncharacterized protein n=1 Tax=Cudoniella acicularis TaxID=354080 RepID=A0A8H4QRB1_9HELO|nr:hypothetical protein G7Y89_g15260 [Cudoniella acicularis]
MHTAHPLISHSNSTTPRLPFTTSFVLRSRVSRSNFIISVALSTDRYMTSRVIYNEPPSWLQPPQSSSPGRGPRRETAADVRNWKPFPRSIVDCAVPSSIVPALQPAAQFIKTTRTGRLTSTSSRATTGGRREQSMPITLGRAEKFAVAVGIMKPAVKLPFAIAARSRSLHRETAHRALIPIKWLRSANSGLWIVA